MAYTSLYRRYRPDTFDGVIGQDHIVRTLKNQLAMGSVGHAYIFTGTRGTGKTSVAKIFARAVNCLHPVDGSPCGECENCKELSRSGNFDILEIDAASNNSVEQIRELTDKIGFPPTIGKYKVYIVDEVHMLSTAAFNALLKTLEEPPQHAIFILATTEIHKIPSTILSRCLRFDFRLVPVQQIAKRLRFIFDDIGVAYEEEALQLIASAGGGSVRDALSLADMCVSYCDGKITYDGVLEVLGASDPKRLKKLAEEIADGDADSALRDVAELCDLGKSVAILAQDIATLFRNVLYIKLCKDAKTILGLPEGIYAGLSELAAKYPAERCMDILKIMSKLEGELRYTSQHRILFEAAVVQASLGGGKPSLEERVARLERAASQRKSGFNAAPVLDARQVWVYVASELNKRKYTLLVSALNDAGMSMTDAEFVLSVTDRGTERLLEAPGAMEALRAAFASTEQAGGRALVIKKEYQIAKEQVIPVLKEQLGDFLEIK